MVKRKTDKRSITLGELRVECDGRKGFSIYHRTDGRLLCWMNQKAEEALITWISQKPYSDKSVPDGGTLIRPEDNPPPREKDD